MIHQFNIQPKNELDYNAIETPPEELLSFTGGLLTNNWYEDMRGYFLPQALQLAIDYETEIISYINKNSKNSKEYQKIIDTIPDDEQFIEANELFSGFEIGIASTSIASIIMGCAPVTSNGGNYFRNKEPSILFWASKEYAKALAELNYKNAYMCNESIEGYIGIGISFPTIEASVAFAQKIQDNYQTFKNIQPL